MTVLIFLVLAGNDGKKTNLAPFPPTASTPQILFPWEIFVSTKKRPIEKKRKKLWVVWLVGLVATSANLSKKSPKKEKNDSIFAPCTSRVFIFFAGGIFFGLSETEKLKLPIQSFERPGRLRVVDFSHFPPPQPAAPGCTKLPKTNPRMTQGFTSPAGWEGTEMAYMSLPYTYLPTTWNPKANHF